MADASYAPGVPPDIRSQQGVPPGQDGAQPGQQAAARAMGGLADPIMLLEQKIAELEQWTSATAQLVEQIHPPSGALLVPIAQAGKALQGQVQQMRQSKGGESPPASQRPTQPNPGDGMPQRPAQ